MIVHVGSKNPAKISAVTNTIKDYSIFEKASVHGFSAPSEISEQPFSLAETIKGAKNRARNCFSGSDYSFGIESGLMEVPETKTGFMDFCVCAIYNGKEYVLGISSAFECPVELINLVKERGITLSQAAKVSNFTEEENIGYGEGIIGILTKGKVTREGYTKQAIQMAMIQLENKELY